MDVLLGLLSLAGLSLFMAYFFKRSASIMPLVAAAAAMLWFTLLGCLGLLVVAGWLWYLGCGFALFWVVYKLRKEVVKLVTPGFLLFVGLSTLVIVLFFITKPMLTQWDEFTVWGTAGQVVKNASQLYTTAQSNLLARSQPPSLAVFGYMMQFFGGKFAEYKFVASYSILYFAAFAAGTTLWDKNKAGAVVAMGCMVLLPFLFTVPAGSVNWVYLSVMADAPLALFFGGALCLYFGAEEKDEILLLGFGLLLAALINIKDIGLALACLAWFIAGADLLFFQRKNLSFFGLNKTKGFFAALGAQLALIVATYGGWLLHLRLALGVDRTNIGSGGTQLSQLEMLVAGIKALLRIQVNEVFDTRAVQMMDAFLNRPIWLFGSGARLLIVVVVVLNFAFFFGSDKHQKRRVLVFGLTSFAGFLAFTIFTLFTYTFIFSDIEARGLASYERYMYPYWFMWLMVSVVLLARAAVQPIVQQIPGAKAKTSAAAKRHAPQLQWRVFGARAASLGLCVVLFVGVAMRANWRVDFMQVSPSLYGRRLDVQHVVRVAQQEGMQEEDVVYLVSQGDDAGRFYLFSYEMAQTLVPLYGGPDKPEGTTAASLFRPSEENVNYPEGVPCSPEQLVAYLKAKGCTHILLDVTDGYFVDDFKYLFEDGLAGWQEENSYEGGRRYYKIEWQGDTARFVLVKAGVNAI